MNGPMKRFLCVNAALNGHSILDAFESPEDAAKHLNTSVETVKKLDAELAALPVMMGKTHLLVSTLLNFMRTTQYAFVTPPGGAPVFLPVFAESDRRGEVPAELRDAILRQLVRDVTPVEDASALPIIRDGMLTLAEPMVAFIPTAMALAYELYRDGPNKSLRILKERHNLSIADYKEFSAKKVMEILNDFVAKGVSPEDVRATTLQVPDFLPVYQKTGCILCTSEEEAESVDWLLPVQGKNSAKSMTVGLPAIRELLVTSLMDLSNMCYSMTKGGLVLKEEV